MVFLELDGVGKHFPLFVSPFLVVAFVGEVAY